MDVLVGAEQAALARAIFDKYLAVCGDDCPDDDAEVTEVVQAEAAAVLADLADAALEAALASAAGDELVASAAEALPPGELDAHLWAGYECPPDVAGWLSAFVAVASTCRARSPSRNAARQPAHLRQRRVLRRDERAPGSGATAAGPPPGYGYGAPPTAGPPPSAPSVNPLAGLLPDFLFK